MITGLIFEIVIGEYENARKDTWLVNAQSLTKALKKAEAIRLKQKELWKGYRIISVRELGELFE